MNEEFHFFPEQASTVAQRVDAIYFFLLAVASFFTLLIFVLIVFFALYYRRGSRADRRPGRGKQWILEVTWSLIPLGLAMTMFGWGAEVFYAQQLAPPGCLEINVVAKQWMWKLHHENGRQEVNELHVPAGRPVRLTMISEDVIHSFYVPAFRVKHDVLPGAYSHLWFEATTPGDYQLFCAEYCGTSHSEMTGKIVVMEEREYADWLRGGGEESPEPPEVAGKRLFETLGCANCHSAATGPACPPLEGLFGRTIALEGGGTTVADEGYLRESIIDPDAKIVQGYKRSVMPPTFTAQTLGETGIFQLIAYMKSLPEPSPPAETQLGANESAFHP